MDCANKQISAVTKKHTMVGQKYIKGGKCHVFKERGGKICC